MADESRIDIRVYGAESVAPRAPAVPTAAPTPAPVAAALAVSGSPLLQSGQAQIDANSRERATMLESTGAAITQWMPAHVYDYFTAPTFPQDVQFKGTDMLKQVDFTMDSTQEEFLLKSRSAPEFNFKVEAMRKQREAYQAMGDNQVTSFVAGALDPGYLAIDVMSWGAARAARLAGAGAAGSRTVAGVSAFGATYVAGKAEQQVVPLSEKQVFLIAMANGAASAVLLRGTRPEPIDPRFPSQELHTITEAAENSAQRDLMRDIDPNFVGPMRVLEAPSNLTVPRVLPTGEGPVNLRYAGGGAVSDYTPSLGLSKGEYSTLVKDGRFQVVQSTADIAGLSEAVRSGRTVIDKGAKAVYLPAEDRIFLIQGNLKKGDDVRGIVLHEYGVHMNAERVLGTETMAKMLDRLEDLAIAGNPRAKRAFGEVPKGTPLHLVREEALGYYVERNHGRFGDGLIRQFVHGIRELLRRSGLSGLKYSESDIMQLVRKAAKGGEKSGKVSFDTTFPYVWHGGPTRGIDQLDTAFVGTGEGRQAFGWGHYVTSEKGTALDYRNKESARRGIAPESGGLYRVKISAPEDAFLNLDSAVQSARVQDALDRLGMQGTGAQVYKDLSKKLGGDVQASQALFAEGVAGNKYATGRTRAADVKSSNYVVFDNSALDITARYSFGKRADELRETLAKGGSWSLHKTISSFSPEGRRVADLLVDDPLEYAGNSVVNQHRTIRADLEQYVQEYEVLLKGSMADAGFGTFKRITSPKDALAAQKAIEREVGMEMLRRNELQASGLPVSHAGIKPEVTKMADALDRAGQAGLAELKNSKVVGAAGVSEASGYFHRRWDFSKMDELGQSLVREGATPAQAKQSVVDMLGISIQRANGWDAELAQDVARATYDRARAKGYFEDSAFRSPQGADALAEVRSILSGSGISNARQQRVLDVLAGKVDEAGKAPILKNRVAYAMDESISLRNGQTYSVADMIDMNMLNITDRYMDTVAARSALARKGLGTATDVQNLRKGLLESIEDVSQREQASKLFDNTVASLYGAPVGEELPRMMRMIQGATQMVGLARAGLFQFTEYATLMQKYGVAATVNSAMRELPVFRSVLSDPAEAAHLRNVLERNASQDIRIRPYIQRMEDNFEIPISDSMLLSMQQAKQLVPYLNGLKYIQNHQARTAGNLIVNVVERAANGDAKALRVLQDYGLELPYMSGISADVRQFGMDTSKWSTTSWDNLRGSVTKMVDDAVLRARTGEIPAFAQFTSTGKFLFTFRSFVLAAHNKVLAGSLHRDGYSGLGLIMLYQFPLTFAITAADSRVVKGKDLEASELSGMAFSQMGSLGLLSELVGVALGNKQQFGSPGTIAIDRVYKLGSSLSSGNAGNVGAAALNSVPLLSIILPIKAIGENLKDNKEK